MLKDNKFRKEFFNSPQGTPLGNLNQKPMENLQMTYYNFPNLQFYPGVWKKSQIILHLSASSDNVLNMIKGWEYTTERVATAYAMGRDGSTYQLFDDKAYAAHIGYYLRGNIATSRWPETNNRTFNLQIEQRTIGIEPTNWGSLRLIEGKYYAWPSNKINSAFKSNVIIDPSDVYRYPEKFRGSEFFQKITDKQVENLEKWITIVGRKHNIPIKYNPDMWDLSIDAIRGKPGLWAHCSFRSDKQDIHPQPNLVDMLKRLRD